VWGTGVGIEGVEVRVFEFAVVLVLVGCVVGPVVQVIVVEVGEADGFIRPWWTVPAPHQEIILVVLLRDPEEGVPVRLAGERLGGEKRDRFHLAGCEGRDQDVIERLARVLPVADRHVVGEAGIVRGAEVVSYRPWVEHDTCVGEQFDWSFVGAVFEEMALPQRVRDTGILPRWPDAERGLTEVEQASVDVDHTRRVGRRS
jgi:hypothetical protein